MARARHRAVRAGSLRFVNRRPKLVVVAPAASPEEAAAIVAALERYMRDTAPTPAPAGLASRPAWARAALLEGTDYTADDATPWGRVTR
jgi:hypothetical protein